jgi:signal transduction histidine kinase
VEGTVLFVVAAIVVVVIVVVVAIVVVIAIVVETMSVVVGDVGFIDCPKLKKISENHQQFKQPRQQQLPRNLQFPLLSLPKVSFG